MEEARRECELTQLREATERSQRGIILPGARVVSIDGTDREVRWFQGRPVMLFKGEIHEIRFEGQPVVVFIDHTETRLGMTESRDVYFGDKFHKIKFGGPDFELIVDEVYPYRLNFEAPDAVVITVDGGEHRARLGGPSPRVEIGPDNLWGQIFSAPPAEGKSQWPLATLNSHWHFSKNATWNTLWIR